MSDGPVTRKSPVDKPVDKGQRVVVRCGGPLGEGHGILPRISVLMLLVALLTGWPVVVPAAETIETTETSERNGGVGRWLDRFFDDQLQRERTTGTLIRVKQHVVIGPDVTERYDTSVSGRLHMPELSRRFSLVLRGDDSPTRQDRREQRIGESLADSVERPAVAIRYDLAPERRWRNSLAVGYRLQSRDPYVGARMQYLMPLAAPWSLTFSERIRSYYRAGLQSETRVYADRPIGQGLFRQEFLLQWDEVRREEVGLRTTLSTNWFYRVSDVTAVQWEIRNVYQTKPVKGRQSSSMSLHLRRRLRDTWLYLDVAPGLSWRRDGDWQTSPGIQVGLEVIFNRGYPTGPTAPATSP